MVLESALMRTFPPAKVPVTPILVPAVIVGGF
jgi:hypothetical protein